MQEAVSTSDLESLKPPYAKTKKSASASRLSPVEAVLVVVNTAVTMASIEPAIDIRSIEESKRGPGILIWIPGYVHDGETVVDTSAVVLVEDAPTEVAKL